MSLARGAPGEIRTSDTQIRRPEPFIAGPQFLLSFQRRIQFFSLKQYYCYKFRDRWIPVALPPPTSHILKPIVVIVCIVSLGLRKHLGRHAKENLPHRLEMGGASLDLLRERVHVAEATLERAAREDRVDARSLVGEVCDVDRTLNRVGAGEPHAGLDRRRLVDMRVESDERLDQVGACRAEPRLRARHIGLHDSVFSEPGEPTRRLAGRQHDELGQHRARDPKRHSGDARRVEGLHGKGIKRAALAAQRRILAGGTERLGHEHVVDTIRVRRRAAQPDRLPGVEDGCLARRKQERAFGGPAKAVEPKRAVRFDHMAVRTQPTGLPAAAGEVPLAGDAIATLNRCCTRTVWRSPSNDTARISKDGMIDHGLQVGGEEAGTVRDECVPRD